MVLQWGGGSAACSVACNPVLPIALAVTTLQGHTVWGAAVPYGFLFRLQLADCRGTRGNGTRGQEVDLGGSEGQPYIPKSRRGSAHCSWLLSSGNCVTHTWAIGKDIENERSEGFRDKGVCKAKIFIARKTGERSRTM